MSRRAPSSGGTYVYCVARAQPFGKGSPPLTTRGIGGRGHVVRAIEYADLAAVVSDAPETRYETSRENLATHQHVLEEAMTRSDVLPVSFGTVASSDQKVRGKLLEPEFDELHRQLDYVRGRVELGLRVLWHRERLFSEIVAENNEVRALRDSTAGGSPDATYYDRIRLGELTAAAINLKRDQEADSLLEALHPLAVETRLNSNITDMMILNAAFLVDRTRVEAFDDAVRAIDEAQAGRLIFRYVGPLPPYNFVNISVSWEE
jgi:Gas vesicle synthesis protein GvpL/GvpF